MVNRIMKKSGIGILTGGGDVPGLNSVIKSVVYGAKHLAREVIGIRRGWQGLTDVNLSQHQDPGFIMPLNRANTRTIDRTGGTVLHTSRTNPARMNKSKLPAHLSAEELRPLQVDEDAYDLTPIVIRNLEQLGIETLIAIGGDDTLGYAAHLSGEGFPVIGIPKTMDNDVPGTEYCIGFSTAITRAKELITRQRTTLGSHERIAVFRMFGRESGFTALYTAYVTSTRCLIPEYPFDLETICRLLVEDKYNAPSRYSLIVISEGATWRGQQKTEFGEADAYGHRKTVDIGHALAAEIRRRTGEETMTSDLTYDLRSGDPDSLDSLIATTFANNAMDLISKGMTGQMVSVRDGHYHHTTLPDPASPPRRVNLERLYDTSRFRPRYDNKLGSPILLDHV